MTDTVTVPTAPALSRIPNVELMHVGQWDISTGVATFTGDDLRSAVAALDCPAVRRPVLKLGHTDPRFDGQPAVGYIDNMAVAADDRTLAGDYAGMPGWLGDVMASAYPDRSIEGEWDHVCQLGHVHPFVVTGVALLGVMAPGIGTLQSLQDVGALYGVAAAPNNDQAGTPVAITVHASEGGPAVPNPNPPKVAATATTEDVRRAYYEDAPWSVWIEEIQLDPLQLISIDDNTGQRFRVPVTVDAAQDGEDAVTFGTPVPVVIRYEDTTAQTNTAAAGRVLFASRAESRPGSRPLAAPAPTAPPAAPEAPASTEDGSTTHEGSAALSFTDSQLTTMRQTLGLAADADEATIVAAQVEALAERADPAPNATVVPEGSVVVPQVQLEELTAAAQAGVAARNRQLTEDRDREIAAAIGDGRIAPARREHWEAAYATDRDGASTALASLPKGLLPVSASGYTDTDTTDPAASDDYWFPGYSTTTVKAG